MGKRLPGWLKMQRASGENYSMVKHLVKENNLNTICTSGNCPNIGECWNAGTATFMILGDICTRACKFCSTKTGKPLPPDPDEPFMLAAAIRRLKLKHCVITSVDRDDLPDRGSSFWALTLRTIREMNPGITIESLIPDFDALPENLCKIVESGPDVVSHNIETVKRMTPLIRTKAKYETSLEVLRYFSGKELRTKSGFMVGLGETVNEVKETISDIYQTGCRILTIGQYLQPTKYHIPPAEFIEPERFLKYKEMAFETGFEFVESNPLVRSSFHAEKHVSSR